MQRLKKKFERRIINDEFNPNLIFLHRKKFIDNISLQNITECQKISNKKIIIFSKLENNSKC